MGDVLLARQKEASGVDRLVALKCIRPDLSEDPHFQNLFRNELRLAARLSHPNIVYLFDFGIEDGEAFLALEYVDGKPLSAILKRARKEGVLLSIEAMLAIAIDVAKGLHYAHELQDDRGNSLDIVHRDIAPANIMVSYGGIAKILDFGIATAKLGDAGPSEGGLMGHLNYMSPEQLSGKSVDRRTDLYAFGALLWEMTVGQRLHDYADPYEAALQIGKEVLPALPELRRGPPGWEGIIRKALSFDPALRYATAIDLQRDVEDVARSAGIGISNLGVLRLLAELFPESATITPAPPPVHKRLTLLCVDDEDGLLDLVRRTLRSTYDISVANGFSEGMQCLAYSPYDIVLSDERMPDGRGLHLLEHVAKTSPGTIRIMVTAYPETRLMLDAINKGHVHRFLAKPFLPSELTALVASAVEEVQGVAHSAEQARLPRRRRRTSVNTADDQTHTQADVTVAERPATGNALLPWEGLRPLASPHITSGNTLLVLVASRPMTTATTNALVESWRAGGINVLWSHAEGSQLAAIFAGDFDSCVIARDAALQALPSGTTAALAQSLIVSEERWLPDGRATEARAKELCSMEQQRNAR
jgi:serine/threonine protein kinase